MAKKITTSVSAWEKKSRREILRSVRLLQKMHETGRLGGLVMPEDANPGLPKASRDNYHYFTLPMALNYQRNSYVLWKSAKEAYLDKDTKAVFDPRLAIQMSEGELKSILTSTKIALQPNKQTQTWRRLCDSICELFDGDIRNLFQDTDGHVPAILTYIQKSEKSRFPYLSGPKICNYWLYVLSQYTDLVLKEKEALTVAPDTHVIQASIQLGLVSPEEYDNPEIQTIVSKEWVNVLKGSEFIPIDIHTPLWLWSRTGFVLIQEDV